MAATKPQATALPAGKAGPVRAFFVPIGHGVRFTDGSTTVITGPTLGRRR